jgi:cytochrome c oxidase cbb3-type subunit 3/ubiquinol-cytochrome c reductase cytochrome c subunit
MSLRLRYHGVLSLVALLAIVSTGCSDSPGRPGADFESVDPDDVSDFATLYAHNCAGCHGPDGKGGAAISLADPTYLAIADESILRRVTASGVPRTQMPAFAKSAGGMLTDRQIDIIVREFESVGRSQMPCVGRIRHPTPRRVRAMHRVDRESTSLIALHAMAQAGRGEGKLHHK